MKYQKKQLVAFFQNTGNANVAEMVKKLEDRAGWVEASEIQRFIKSKAHKSHLQSEVTMLIEI